jgi:rubrerythrin
LKTFRSRKNGSHYPISKGRQAGSRSTGVAHLGVPKRISKNSTYEIGYLKYSAGLGMAHWNSIKVKAQNETQAFRKAEKRFKAIEKREGSKIERESIKISNIEHKVEAKNISKKLNSDLKDESAGTKDYNSQANQLDKAGFPIQADELRHIARQETEHKKIVEQVKQDVNETQKPFYVFWFDKRSDDEFHHPSGFQLSKRFATKEEAEEFMKNSLPEGARSASVKNANEHVSPHGPSVYWSLPKGQRTAYLNFIRKRK